MPDRPFVLDWATDWDHIGRQYHESAPEVWDELRERCPVAHTGRFEGAWLPVLAADITAVAHDPTTFSSVEVNLFDVKPKRMLFVPPITADPPDHTAYRRVMLPRFTLQEMDKLAPATEAICNQLIDRFINDGSADAGVDYAQHVPTLVTAKLLGLPDSDADQFRQWIHELIELGQDDIQIGRRATLEVLDYFADQLNQRRQQGGDDLTALVAKAEIDGVPMPERTQAAMLLVLLIGGIDTTWTTLGAALLHLATHAEDQARLRAEPELLETALEEFLRFYAPVEIGRLVTHDTEVGGCPVAAGEHVWLSYPAANRDPSVFPDADRFIIDRRENRHLTFGVGVHRCLGSNLARMELRVALDTWLKRVPSFRVPDGRSIGWSSGGNVRGPREIPVVF
ncbi:MAG: hypothetical protein QOJ19_267 [Acidimicrobiia bacterium]|jgi:cytochrome P450|nr:hypothetical protein [Acidimicrobiia bacterium]